MKRLRRKPDAYVRHFQEVHQHRGQFAFYPNCDRFGCRFVVVTAMPRRRRFHAMGRAWR